MCQSLAFSQLALQSSPSLPGPTGLCCHCDTKEPKHPGANRTWVKYEPTIILEYNLLERRLCERELARSRCCLGLLFCFRLSWRCFLVTVKIISALSPGRRRSKLYVTKASFGLGARAQRPQDVWSTSRELQGMLGHFQHCGWGVNVFHNKSV